jgi:hypothetical protein
MSTACSEEQYKREKRNRKQHEYRARKRAEETIEEREERNKRQCDYLLAERLKQVHFQMHRLN